MNTTNCKSFYLFKGDWYNRFIELLDLLGMHQQRFVILEPKDKTKEHNLIIVYGGPLQESYCFSRNIWKTEERIFDSFYKHKLEKFNVHSDFHPQSQTEQEEFSWKTNFI
jgi:hypothetical protein